MTLDEVARRRQMLETARTRTHLPRNHRFTPDERAFLDGLRLPGRNPWGETDPGAPETLIPVAQLYYRDVPGLPFGDWFDLLQVLWCPFDHEPHQSWPSVHLYWRDTGSFAGVSARPPGSTVVGYQEYVPHPCTLTPEPVTDYPDYDLLPKPLHEAVEAWEGNEDPGTSYRDIAVVPGWKTGGWGTAWALFGAHEVTCECGAPAEPLLTVAGSEWDTDTVAYWMPVEEQHLTEWHNQHRNDVDVTIGRGYDLQIFHCGTDPAHAPVTVMV
ncbi:hypothetical protein [Glycomyces niveus]|uniref:DUF1963 domain-containing protein n=1 Tax=Glycomyces niveus TaxID=2820287 RepID=A0ABS3UA94_9ACTN|nr:hypothetical protein [Glycomyces sp. NEAU-S30]MBO3735703.1 hypothetical protein [Glycomyces sp. NEAU-S30]